MKVWWCGAAGEAWDLEVHQVPPCDWTIDQFGESPGEHDLCGFRLLIPVDAVEGT